MEPSRNGKMGPVASARARDAPRTVRILDQGDTVLALAKTTASRSNTTVDAAAWFGTHGPPCDTMASGARGLSFPGLRGGGPRASGIDAPYPEDSLVFEGILYHQGAEALPGVEVFRVES